VLTSQIKTGVADGALSPFLSTVLPAMESALEANADSSAFEESDAFADDSQVRALSSLARAEREEGEGA
jgi:hypothetical protein